MAALPTAADIRESASPTRMARNWSARMGTRSRTRSRSLYVILFMISVRFLSAGSADRRMGDIIA